MSATEFSTPPLPRQPTWRWSDLVLIVLGVVVFFILGFLILGAWMGLNQFAPGEEIQPTLQQSLGVAALEAIALVGAVYLLGMRRRGLSWEAVGLRPISWRWVMIVTVITFIAIPLTGLITILVVWALGLPFENPQLDFLIPEGFSWLGVAGMVLLGGVAAPIGEELLFRGVLYKLLRERWGLWPGVLASSLIFALVHGDIAVGVSALFLGIILALVFEYSRTLWAPILVHILNNSLKIILLYVLVGLGLTTSLGL